MELVKNICKAKNQFVWSIRRGCGWNWAALRLFLHTTIIINDLNRDAWCSISNILLAAANWPQFKSKKRKCKVWHSNQSDLNRWFVFQKTKDTICYYYCLLWFNGKFSGEKVILICVKFWTKCAFSHCTSFEQAKCPCFCASSVLKLRTYWSSPLPFALKTKHVILYAMERKTSQNISNRLGATV